MQIRFPTELNKPVPPVPSAMQHLVLKVTLHIMVRGISLHLTLLESSLLRRQQVSHLFKSLSPFFKASTTCSNRFILSLSTTTDHSLHHDESASTCLPS